MNVIVDNWSLILKNVKEEHELTDISFKTWLEPLTVHSVQGNTVFILVPDQQQTGLDYIAKKYSLPLRVAIGEVTGKEYDIEFILSDSISKNDSSSVSNASKNDSMLLNPNYTFDKFVVGANNRLAHTYSLAVAESPGEVYNPLYIYGGSGLGKTHLMQAIAHFAKNQNPNLTVRYVSSEKFTNDLIDAIGNGSNRTEFKRKYREVDILLIDDIQFIMGKERTQEEFFNIFNELHSIGKQIVITCDIHPSKMTTLEERLRTRLEMGLQVDVNIPDYETRMAILKNKQKMDGYHLSDEVLDYVASNIKSNVRELEGALNKLIAYSNLEGKEITYDIAVRELQNFITPDRPKEITADLVIRSVCEHYHISEADIVSSKKNASIAYPRQVAMYLCYQLLEGITYNAIGLALGGKDHTTVMHGIKKITGDLVINTETQNNVDIITKKITPI